MRSSRLVVVLVLASACGPDGSEPLLTCDVGPVFRSTANSCELVIDGNGGPNAALLWTIEAEDETGWYSFELASDGGVYVFGDGVLARFGPSREFEWSRSFVLHATDDDDSGPAEIQAGAVGPDGLDIAVMRGLTALIHLRDGGECVSVSTLAFGGEHDCNVEDMVREPDRLVLTGTHTESGYSRGFVQQRSFAGELIREAEIDDNYYEDVDYPRVLVGGPERYVVSYSGYAPQGIYSSYSSGQLFDESLTSVGPSRGKYSSDAFGTLYTVSDNSTAGDEFQQPPEEAQPPTLYRVTRSQTPDAPAGETIELEVPQPQCGWPHVALFDESLSVVTCSPPGSPRIAGCG
jgi:hypothetical protein